MRPAVKSYVFFDKHPEGVLFRGGQEAFVLKGRGLYPLVARLVNALDGREELPALKQRVPEKLHPLLDTLVGELGRRNFIVDRGFAADEDASMIEHEFGTLLDYLTDHGPDAVGKFLDWRKRRVLLGISGQAGAAALQAACELGASDIHLVRFEAPHPIRDAGWENAAGRTLAPSVTVHATLFDAPHCDFAIYAADGIDESRVPEFGSRAGSLALAGGFRGRAIALHFDDAAVAAATLSDIRPVDDEVEPSASQLIIAVNLAAYHVFREATGLTSGALRSGREVGLDLKVQEIGFAEASAAVRSGAEASDRVLSPFERLKERLEAAFDPAVGFLATPREEPGHLPLYHYAIALRTPAGDDRQIVAWGLGAEDAGRRALCHAVGEAMRLKSGLATDALVRVELEDADVDALAMLDLAAAARDPAKRASSMRHSVTFDEVGGDAIVLWRLAEILAGQAPSLEVLSWEGTVGLSAILSVEGEERWVGAGPTHEAAIVEVLGEYVSHLRRGTPLAVLTDARFAHAAALDDPMLAGAGLTMAVAARGDA